MTDHGFYPASMLEFVHTIHTQCSLQELAAGAAKIYEALPEEADPSHIVAAMIAGSSLCLSSLGAVPELKTTPLLSIIARALPLLEEMAADDNSTAGIEASKLLLDVGGVLCKVRDGARSALTSRACAGLRISPVAFDPEEEEPYRAFLHNERDLAFAAALVVAGTRAITPAPAPIRSDIRAGAPTRVASRYLDSLVVSSPNGLQVIPIVSSLQQRMGDKCSQHVELTGREIGFLKTAHDVLRVAVDAYVDAYLDTQITVYMHGEHA